MTKRKAYCFNCKHEIDVKLGTEPCPLCGSDDWNFAPSVFRHIIK